MTTKQLMYVAVLCAALAQSAHARPELLVTCGDVDLEGNHNYLVQVVPDGTGSIYAGLAFAIDDAELNDVIVNTAAWDHEAAGFNPFTNDITIGLWLDQIGDRTYGAFGSIIFSSSDPVDLFTIKTSPDMPQTIRWGVAASGDNEYGATMAQGGESFYGYTGALTCVPEPSTILLAVVGMCGLGLAVRRR